MSVPAATAAGRSRAIAAPAPGPLRLPPAPRRVSGPARHPRAASAAPAVASPRWLALIDHPWLDRLIRGRVWIAIVAAALLGIVAVQVMLLRIGAQIGSQTTAVNALIARNETASATIATLEASGGAYGASATAKMVDPPPNDVTYLRADSADAARAASEMRPPSAASKAAETAAASFTATPATVTTVAPATSAAAASTGATGATAATGATSATAAAPATGATSTTAVAAGTTAAATGATSTTAVAAGTTATATGATATTGAPAPTAAGTTTTSGAAAPAQVPATSQGGAVVAPASQGG